MTEISTIAECYRDWLALRKVLEDSGVELSASLDRYLAMKPAVPDELIHSVRTEGKAMSNMCRGGTDAHGRDVDYRGSDFWRTQIKAIESGLNSAFTQLECVRLLALSEKYEADVDRAFVDSGHKEADDRHGALHGCIHRLEVDIASAKPKCLSDVRLKAIVVKHWMHDAASEHIVDALLDSLASIPEAKAA